MKIDFSNTNFTTFIDVKNGEVFCFLDEEEPEIYIRTSRYNTDSKLMEGGITNLETGLYTNFTKGDATVKIFKNSILLLNGEKGD